MTRVRVPLYVSILAVFLAVTLVLTTALTWIHYANTERGALTTASALFADVRERVFERQTSLLAPLATAVTVYASDPRIARGDVVSLRDPFIALMEQHTQISLVYVGFESGAHYEVYRFGSEAEALSIGAPAAARYAVHAIAANRKSESARDTWSYLDGARAEILHREGESAYDPRRRGWYQQARATPDAIVRTPPYVFATPPTLGLTFARSFDGPAPGVVAADLRMDRMSHFLRQLKAGERRTLFMFDAQGRLTADDDPERVVRKVTGGGDGDVTQLRVDDLGEPLATWMLARFRVTGPYPVAPVRIDRTTYLTTVVELPRALGADEHFAFAVPRDEFASSILEIGRQSLEWALAIAALSVPVITILARRISRPLGAMAREADRIRRFELEGEVPVRSRIREIQALTESVDNMKNALRQMSKFVPRALVQDLIGSGASLEVGGERREMSFVFTDVRDFTPLSEKMEPEALMLRMSEYFEALVRVILEHRGTVDKYVGDAIFAYWNAPLRDEEHVARACAAALACRAASTELNATWEVQGRPAWYTRFGVHVGDAVVGNVGSSDRIDYTVIGAAVNIASRLEGLNKFYGTQILASGAVCDRTAERFLFRAIDRVLPVGAIHPIDIHELIGDREAGAAEAENGARALCHEWNEAREPYEARDWRRATSAFAAFGARHPNDRVAQIYLARATGFASSPPPDGWDGVTRFDQK